MLHGASDKHLLVVALEGSGGDLDGDLEGRRADEKGETDSCIRANSSLTGMDNAPPKVFWSKWMWVWRLPSVYALGE